MKSWTKRKLGEATTVLSGATPRTAVAEYWNGALLWVTPKDLGALETVEISSTERRITQAGFEACSTQLVPPNSVVMSSRAPIGHLAINTAPVCTNQGCKSFIPSNELDVRFLYWTLRAFMPEIQHLGSGCTFDEVSKTDVEEFEIPIPTLAEQRRIVVRVEALTRRLDKARQARQAAFAEAAAMLAWIQQSSYEQLLQEHNSIPLSEVGEVVSGGTPSKARTEFWDGDIPWVAPKEMKVFRIGESSMNVTNLALAEGGAKIIPEPAVLMVVRGMILAKRVPVAVSTQPLTINQDMKAFMPHNGIESEFLAHMLCGAGDKLKGRVEVAVHGTCKLETEAWGSLPVPLPSPVKQRAIVAKLDAMAAKLGELQRLQREVETELASFTPALLSKAFRGEL